jgi:hypothetical protein
MTKEDIMARCKITNIKFGVRVENLITMDKVIVAHGNDRNYQEDAAISIMSMLVDMYMEKVNMGDLRATDALAKKFTEMFDFVRNSKTLYYGPMIAIDVDVPDGLRLIDNNLVAEFVSDIMAKIWEKCPDLELIKGRYQNTRTVYMELKIKK